MPGLQGNIQKYSRFFFVNSNIKNYLTYMGIKLYYEPVYQTMNSQIHFFHGQMGTIDRCSR